MSLHELLLSLNLFFMAGCVDYYKCMQLVQSEDDQILVIMFLVDTERPTDD